MAPIDWETQLQQWLAESSVSLRALLDELARQHVTLIEVEYDGSGDSGQVERVIFTGPTGPVPASEPADLVVEQYVRALLEYHQPGWEDNEGSFGTVRINPVERSVTLEHSTRFTDYCETTLEQAL
jgi:hypothetical protein